MDLFIVFLAGLAVSFVSSFGSGVLGIASITALTALGLSPLTALGTFRVGSIGFSLGGLYQYFKAGKIVWSLLVPMTLFGAGGVILGVNLIVSLDEGLIGKILGAVMLLFIPFTIFKPKLGLIRSDVSKAKRWWGHVSVFFTSLWGSSVTVGTGFLVAYSQMYFYGLTLLEVKGTNRIPILLKTFLAVIIFAYHSLIDWRVGLVFAAGMFIGSFIGTKYVIKLGDTWFRYILLGTIALFSLKLILGY